MISKVKKFFLNDYGLSLFNKIYSILTGIVSSAFYVRYLGLEYKGTYSYINEITTIIGLILNFGIYQSYPFFYRKHGDKIFSDYANTFVLQFLIYSVASVVVAVCFRNNAVTVMVCLQLPFLVLKTQLDNVIIIEKIKVYMWVDMGLKTLLTFVYMLLWLIAPVHISYVVITVALTNLLVCIIYLQIMKYRFSLVNLKPNIPFVKKVVNFGFYPMLSALLLTLNYSVDIIFLRHMGSAIELSLYSVAAVIINYVWVIPNAFKEVLISKVARSDSDDQVAFSCRISLMITWICFIGFALIGKIAIKIVFGSDFVDCYMVTMLLFAGAFSMIFFKILGVVFVTEGHQKEYFVILLVSSIINIIANYLLIPAFGMYGAGFSSVASYSVCGLAFLHRYCLWKKAKPIDYIFINKSDLLIFKNILRLEK